MIRTTTPARGVSQALPWTSCVITLVLALAAVVTTVPPDERLPDERRSSANDVETISHVLNRMSFGPALGDVERVRETGLERYIEHQLNSSRIEDRAVAERLASFETLRLSTAEIAERYYSPAVGMRRDLMKRAAGKDMPAPGEAPAAAEPAQAETARRQAIAVLTPEARRALLDARRDEQRILGELGQQKLLRAVYSERQLEEVLVDFWFNHFNVFAGKGPVRVYLTEYERDAIRPHALGSFRELLGAVAASPAMLFYLDNWQSSDPELAARLDRAMDRVGTARRAPKRRQNPVDASRGGEARRFQDMTPEQRTAALEQLRARMPRGLNENYARELLELHTLGVDGGYTQQDVVAVAKAFTGWTIRTPRRGGGFWFDERRHVKGPKRVLGTTIDKGGRGDGEAVLDLVARHPSTATFIATKLARRFVADDPPPALIAKAAETFKTTGGNLREVTRTILMSPAMVSPEARRSKVKTPLEFVASALRASGAEVKDAGSLLRSLREMGMPLYFAQPPTGYVDSAELWTNSGALLSRMNFAVALVNQRLPGVTVDLFRVWGGADLDATRRRLLEQVLQGEASQATQAILAKASDVPQLAALTLGSPEFQRR